MKKCTDKRNHIVIRKSSKIDIVHRLDRDIFPEDTYSELLDILWYIAWCDGKPVGFAGLKATGGESAFLIRCGVLSDYRGLGLQTKLLKIREKAAKAAGIKRLYTYTVVDNIHSSNNLMKNGYRLYDAGYLEEDNILYWQKNI